MSDAVQPVQAGGQPTPPNLDLLCRKIAAAVQQVVGKEMAKLPNVVLECITQAVLGGGTPSDAARTGISLPLVEPLRAATLKGDIKGAAIDRQGLIDIGQLAKLLSLSKRTVWALMSSESIPQPLRFGRFVRWREVEILAWLEEGCPPRYKWEIVRKKAVRDSEAARSRR